jgi:hypothetical protein
MAGPDDPERVSIIFGRPGSGKTHSLARFLADASTGEMRALIQVFDEAHGMTREELAAEIEGRVPRASFFAPLLRDAGMPLATWIATFIALLALVIALRETPTLTPEQVEEIITRVVAEVDTPPAAEDPRPPKPRDVRPG